MPIRPEYKARYPKDWALRSRFVRFYRAKNRCEWCGAENYKPHPVTGSKVVLTTAHVFDHRPETASLLNLAALCQKCHNGHDAKMRRKNHRERVARENPQFGLLDLTVGGVVCGPKHPTKTIALVWAGDHLRPITNDILKESIDV